MREYTNDVKLNLGRDLIDKALSLGAEAHESGHDLEHKGTMAFVNPWGLNIKMDFTITCEKINDNRD